MAPVEFFLWMLGLPHQNGRVSCTCSCTQILTIWSLSNEFKSAMMLYYLLDWCGHCCLHVERWTRHRGEICYNQMLRWVTCSTATRWWRTWTREWPTTTRALSLTVSPTPGTSCRTSCTAVVLRHVLFCSAVPEARFWDVTHCIAELHWLDPWEEWHFP